MMTDHRDLKEPALSNGWYEHTIVKAVGPGYDFPEELTREELLSVLHKFAFEANLKSGRNVPCGAPKTTRQAIIALHDILLASDLTF